MQLLSTQETRLSVMTGHYLAVLLFALRELFTRGDAEGRKTLGARGRAVLAMSRATLSYATTALKAW
jgi:hypothetical protein